MNQGRKRVKTRSKWEGFLENHPISGVISLKKAELPLKLSLDDPALPLGPAPATGCLGPGQESAFPLSPIRPSHKGLGLVFFKGLNSSGDLTPSTPGLLHAESYSLAIQSAVLFPALWIPSLVSTKEDPTEGMGQVGRPPSPAILSSIEPLPHARPCAGLWDPGDSQSCRGDRDGWRDGSPNFQGREGEVSWWS